MKINLFEKIKDFFSNIFNSKKLLNERNNEINEFEIKVVPTEKNMFEKANEYTNLISLQKSYIQGKIKEKDMTKEQIQGLEKLFDEQIENTKRNNENLRRKIYKELTTDKSLMDIYKRFKLGEISEKELDNIQIKQINFLLDAEIE